MYGTTFFMNGFNIHLAQVTLTGLIVCACPSIPAAENLTELEEARVTHGSTLFNGKAACFGCHGRNGDITTEMRVSRLNPRLTDLREPSDKSVRQLYLRVMTSLARAKRQTRYGIPGTAMVPIQETAGLRHEDVVDVIIYVLSLQGKHIPSEEVFRQTFKADGETDLAIQLKCEAEYIADSDARAFLRAPLLEAGQTCSSEDRLIFP